MTKKPVTKRRRITRTRKSVRVPVKEFNNLDAFKKHFYPKSAVEKHERSNDNDFGADLALSSLRRHAPNV